MVRALARKKAPSDKLPGSARPAKKVSGKTKIRTESSRSNRLSSSGKDLRKAKKKTLAMKTERKGVKHSRPSVSEEPRSTEAETRKPIVPNRITPAPEVPPRLLSDSKSTAAALNLLEKGIKLIYQKDFKKARAELKSLIESHPDEAEIVARARSYIQICDREEAAHKKPPIGNDQLYTLGVMEHNRGNYDAAITNFQQSLEKRPDADYIYYSLAASLAMKGSAEEAVQCLRKAVELSEANRIYAKNDADFLALQGQKEFIELVGINQSPNHQS